MQLRCDPLVRVLRARAARDDRGSAFVAFLIMLIVLGAALGTMVVMADRIAQFERTDSATSELEKIYRAIVGDQRNTFGYLGDVGDYPTSLADLVVNPGAAGWNGPYLVDPRIAGGQLLDPYGQPFEYYALNAGAGSDRLAIISRGPDGQSTNTAANPNLAASWSGLAPTASTYFSDSKNADNRVFPLPDASHADALNVNTTSTLAVILNNFDQNPLLNAFVPACPGLFNITVTSVSRNTDDVATQAFAPGFQALLPQGAYRIVISSPQLPTPPVDDTFTIVPVVPVNRTYNLTGLDSSGTDPTPLQVVNSFPAENLDVYSFATKLGTVNAGQTANYTPKACSNIKVTKGGDQNTVRDSFVMTLAALVKQEGANAATLTVTNNQSGTVVVYNGATQIGTVGVGKTVSFSTNLFAGDTITIKRQSTGVTLATFVLNAGANSRTV